MSENNSSNFHNGNPPDRPHIKLPSLATLTGGMQLPALSTPHQIPLANNSDSTTRTFRNLSSIPSFSTRFGDSRTEHTGPMEWKQASVPVPTPATTPNNVSAPQLAPASFSAMNPNQHYNQDVSPTFTPVQAHFSMPSLSNSLHGPHGPPPLHGQQGTGPHMLPPQFLHSHRYPYENVQQQQQQQLMQQPQRPLVPTQVSQRQQQQPQSQPQPPRPGLQQHQSFDGRLEQKHQAQPPYHHSHHNQPPPQQQAYPPGLHLPPQQRQQPSLTHQQLPPPLPPSMHQESSPLSSLLNREVPTSFSYNDNSTNGTNIRTSQDQTVERNVSESTSIMSSTPAYIDTPTDEKSFIHEPINQNQRLPPQSARSKANETVNGETRKSELQYRNNQLSEHNDFQTNPQSELNDNTDERDDEQQHSDMYEDYHQSSSSDQGADQDGNKSLNFNPLLKRRIPKGVNKSKFIQYQSFATPDEKKTNDTRYIEIPTHNSQKKKVYVVGAPKTSRFYRYTTAETPRQAFEKPPAKSMSSITHHYNPFMYPQNKNRVNPHPDLVSTRSSGYKANDDTPSEVPPIPIITPTVEEFNDPIALIESLTSLGEKYGAVKIVAPKALTHRFASNLESLWFKTRRQLWNSDVNDLNARYVFHKNLLRAGMENNVSVSRLPCIDKRIIDLYRLQKSVHLRGGYENCCREKLWAQVGRELGFYGKITSSLSSSIKSAYQRYVLPLDLNYEQEVGFTYEDHIQPIKRQKLDDGFSYLPRIIGSSTEFKRNRELLVKSGFDPYFDQATTQRKGITVNDESTIPNYDFYSWHADDSTDDCSLFETRISSLYNLKQFNDKSRAFKEQVFRRMGNPDGVKLEDQAIEKKFWEILSDPKSVLETEIAVKVPTSVHESGFYTKPNVRSSSEFLSPWNIHNIPICDNSLLQYLSEDADSILRPSLTFGMFFSSQSWNLEDHLLYSADFQHLGNKKLWYFIPPKFQKKYEEVLQDFVKRKEEQDSDVDSHFVTFNNLVSNSDAYTVTLENRVISDPMAPRREPKNAKFKGFVSTEKPSHFNEEIFISPKYLKKCGIDVYGTYQEPGEYIIKFPKSYSSNVSLGTTVNETVNFATESWLKFASQATGWLAKQQIVPKFSTFKLLINVANNCDNRDTIMALEPILETMINEELHLRDAIRNISSVKETNISSTDLKTSITDADLVDTYPSYIVLSDKDQDYSKFTMSLKYFLNNYNPDIYDFKIELITVLSDESLKNSKKLVKMKLLTGEKWLEKYEAVIDGYDKPPTKLVKPLLVEGEQIFRKKNQKPASTTELRALEFFDNLKKNVQLTDDWVSRASKFLQAKVSTRMRQRRTADIQVKDSNKDKLNDIEELDQLLKEIPHLPVSTPEMDQLIEFANELMRFNDSVSTLLSDDSSPDNDTVVSLHLLGESFGVKLNSFLILDRILKRNNWLKKVSDINYGTSTEEIKSLIDESEFVASSDDTEQVAQLTDLYNKAIAANNDLEWLVHRTPLNILEIQSLYEKYESLPIKNELRNVVLSLIREYEITLNHIEPLCVAIEKKRKLKSKYEDETLSQIDVATQFFALTSNISQQNLSEIIEKSSKFSNLGPRVDQFKGILKSIDSWYEQLYSTFKELPPAKKLKSYFEGLLESNELIFGEEPDSANYCVCRLTHENGIMIECESCEQWFHFNCIGLQEDDENDNNINGYLCPICDLKEKFKTTTYQNNLVGKKPTYKALIEFILSSASTLVILPPEFEYLLQIAKSCYLFKLSLSELKYDDDGELIEDDLDMLRYVSRKLEGSKVNFEDERVIIKNRLRELLSKVEPKPTNKIIEDTEVTKEAKLLDTGVSGKVERLDSQVTEESKQLDDEATREIKPLNPEVAEETKKLDSEVNEGANEGYNKDDFEDESDKTVEEVNPDEPIVKIEVPLIGQEPAAEPEPVVEVEPVLKVEHEGEPSSKTTGDIPVEYNVMISKDETESATTLETIEPLSLKDENIGASTEIETKTILPEESSKILE